MAEQRLPISRNMKIAAFSGGTVTDYSSYMQNAMVDTISSDTGERHIVTQRPSINIVEDASDTVAKNKGRGIFYWDAGGADYFVNDDTIYKADYTATIGTITTGTHKCSFHEVGSVLVLVDPENNEVWTITTGGVLAQVTDPDLPSSIVGSGVTLDGYLFLIDNEGTISQSDLDDATSWNALNFVNAERDTDGGIGLELHHDHVIAFGKDTIEVFYNAANATGSVLSRRQDIFFNVGCPSEEGIWKDGDSLYFLGRSQRGDYGIYLISNFRLQKISTSDLDTFLTSTYTEGSFSILVAGFSSRGHNFLGVTLYTTPSSIDPTLTFVYDSTTKIWGPWTTDLSELSAIAGFPVIDWTTSSANRFGSGMLTNGDIVTLKSDLNPGDSFGLRYYLEDEDDYVVTDYLAPFGVSGNTVIPLICRMGHIDSGSNRNKFGSVLEVIGDYTSASQTLTLKWSDTDHSTFTTTRTIDLINRDKLSRIGKYNRRTYQLEYSGDEIVRLESLEYNVKGGLS